MATATEAPVQTGWLILPDQKITLYGVDWPTYLRLVEIIGDRPIRKAINRGVLELMSPGPIHEDYKGLLNSLVEILAEESEIPELGLGSTTWDRPEVERAIEPDQCFMLTAGKVEMARLRPARIEDYPAPDLAIEVDLRASAVDRAEIYATLRVPEVWRFDGETLRIDRLGPEGTYQSSSESLFLPITPAEVTRWILNPERLDGPAWRRAFRAWVRAEVVPRGRPPAGH